MVSCAGIAGYAAAVLRSRSIVLRRGDHRTARGVAVAHAGHIVAETALTASIVVMAATVVVPVMVRTEVVMMVMVVIVGMVVTVAPVGIVVGRVPRVVIR